MERTELYRKVQGPLSLASLLACILGLAFGWILFMLGITLYFDMGGFPKEGPNQVTTFHSIQVAITGVAFFVAGYFGWKGYMRFAY